jgi:hypothetical protein
MMSSSVGMLSFCCDKAMVRSASRLMPKILTLAAAAERHGDKQPPGGTKRKKQCGYRAPLAAGVQR